MGNKYQYLDPELIYTNKNGILHNIAKIEDEKIEEQHNENQDSQDFNDLSTT